MLATDESAQGVYEWVLCTIISKTVSRSKVNYFNNFVNWLIKTHVDFNSIYIYTKYYVKYTYLILSSALKLLVSCLRSGISEFYYRLSHNF